MSTEMQYYTRDPGYLLVNCRSIVIFTKKVTAIWHLAGRKRFGSASVLAKAYCQPQLATGEDCWLRVHSKDRQCSQRNLLLCILVL